MASTAPAAQTRPMALGIIVTLAVILPVFLVGALAVQIRADLALRPVDIGYAVGAFFAGAALGSTPLGHVAQQLGPVLSMRIGLLITAASTLAIAAAVEGPLLLGLLMFTAGAANSMAQPAVNLMLVRVIKPARLGLAMALKQSGMPAASLVGGAAVPALALTVGWRAAFLGSAGLALAATFGVESVRSGSGADRRSSGPGTDSTPAGVSSPTRPRTARPIESGRRLVAQAVVGVLGGGAANILVGYLVSGAVDAGIAEGPAGLVLVLGSAAGIVSRLIHGRLADLRRLDPLTRVRLLLGLGAVAAVAMVAHTPAAYLLAAPVVFGAGWAWPGLFNLAVVRANGDAAASATGVTQTGVYAGSVVGPIVAGFLIGSSGYGPVWLVTAGLMAGAAAIVHGLIDRRPVTGVGTRTAGDTVSSIPGHEQEEATDHGRTSTG